ncbi:hypothetical protein PAMA_003860 [Pampus argenteus]
MAATRGEQEVFETCSSGVQPAGGAVGRWKRRFAEPSSKRQRRTADGKLLTDKWRLSGAKHGSSSGEEALSDSAAPDLFKTKERWSTQSSNTFLRVTGSSSSGLFPEESGDELTERRSRNEVMMPRDV